MPPPATTARAPLTPMAWLRWDVVGRLLDPLPPGTRVLEIGAGQGGFAARLAALAHYVGVEPDERSAQVAADRVTAVDPGARMLVGGIEAVTDSAPFDVVCAFEVLEHIVDDHGALHSWIDRLRPGGLLVVSVPAFQRRFARMDTKVGHVRRYDPDQLRALLTGSGLSVEALVLYGYPLGFALEWTRNRVLAREAPQTSMAERTGRSGRLYQPRDAVGWLTEWGTWPFRVWQRRYPGRGTGLVAAARLPG
jgi:SAM-dependent methyltransferase